MNETKWIICPISFYPFFMCDCPFLCPFLSVYAVSYRGIFAIMFICSKFMAGGSIGLPYLKKSL